MTPTIISLTTIPSRIDRIFPTLKSLLDQTAKIDRIVLNIPTRYRRGGSIELSKHILPGRIEINCCEEDYGPATKILPTLAMLARERTDDARIIYGDDDRIYSSEWAQNLLTLSDKHPGDCITYQGRYGSSYIANSKVGRGPKRFLKKPYYVTKFRKIKRTLSRSRDLVDVAEGFGGVLVRPSFFDASIFTIPDIIWTVDDIWLSGHMIKNGVKIRKLKKSRRQHKAVGWNPQDALLDFSDSGYGRDEANVLAIRYFQDRHKIWLDI
jgi:hypothetical protein